MDLEHRSAAFPDAIQIVDLYHARQHLWELAAKLYPNDAPRQRRWMMTKQDKLDNVKWKAWSPHCALWLLPIRSWQSRSAPKRTILRRIPNACAISSFAGRNCSSAPV